MNFYTIRYTILAIIIVITVVIFLKVTKKQINNKKVTMMVIISIIVYEIVFSIVPEERFLTFESVEDALSYSFKGKKIIHKIEGKKAIFIEYGKDKYNVSYTYFTKENGKIKFRNPKEDNVKFFSYNYETGIIIKTEQGEILVAIEVIQLKNKTEELIIGDTIDSKFDKIISEDELGNIIFYYTILEEDVPDDYYLLINERLVDIKPYLK